MKEYDVYSHVHFYGFDVQKGVNEVPVVHHHFQVVHHNFPVVDEVWLLNIKPAVDEAKLLNIKPAVDEAKLLNIKPVGVALEEKQIQKQYPHFQVEDEFSKNK